MPSADDQLVIEPVAAPLSGRTDDASARLGILTRLRTKRRAWWFGGALAALGGVAAFVFVALPEQVEAPVRAPGTTPPATAPSAAVEDDAPPPYQALQMQRAREQAQERLNDFVALQLDLEDTLNVGAWGADDLAAAKERANAGDALFLETRFEAALLEYAAAVDALRELAAKGDARFEAALAEGNAALDARDPEGAAAAFARAQSIRPDEPRVVAGIARADALPEVVRLLREAVRARLRADADAEYGLLLEVRQLDPATDGLPRAACGRRRHAPGQSPQGVAEPRFRGARSGQPRRGAAASSRTTLQEFPDDAAALAGKQQAEQARMLAAIDDLREAAARQMRAEQWADALATYDQALAIDSSLKFAREGREVVDARVALIDAMDEVVADPSSLSSDQIFKAAQRTLADATAQTDAGELFAARLARFENVLKQAAVPIPLVLVSDNATEVTIHRVGAIGAFERHELALRPGRYVIVGSRDGCRDVRKEIVLADGMAPVDIRCAERI